MIAEEKSEGDAPNSRRTQLQHGKDFDDVVLAISVGALANMTRGFEAVSPRWGEMIANVHGVRTQAFQRWLNGSAADMGAKFDDGTQVRSEILSAEFLTQPTI